MKKVLFALMMMIGLGATAQEGSLTWHTDLGPAVEKAIAEDKPMFMFFTGSDWCGWCKRLQTEVFVRPEFEQWAKDNVILMELDYPRRTAQAEELKLQNMNILRMFGVRGYPTIWFVNPSKKESEINFGKIGSVGYVKGGPEPWIAQANKIIAAQP